MKTGILLTNTGTPDAPTAQAVRRYLREFLSDRRVVQIPRPIWLPILYGLILTIRPKRSAALYQKIWLDDGSPMRVWMNKLTANLQRTLGNNFVVALGMNYGNPSIADGMKTLKMNGAERFLILPLFPQYSTTSTGSSFDRVIETIKAFDFDHTPLKAIRSYASNDHYIKALRDTVEAHWKEHGRGNKLLISFHGIPERLVRQGDPYQHECEMTAHTLADTLMLNNDEWILCYQSQFGYDKWLKPSTQVLLEELPSKGFKKLDIICPGFALDCLETLEEIAETGKKSFIAAGGESLNYIPALNDSKEHISALAELVREQYPSEHHFTPILDETLAV